MGDGGRDWRFGSVRQTTQIGDVFLPINGFGGST
jgi:hypothetical protein